MRLPRSIPRPQPIHLFVLAHFLYLGAPAVMRYVSGHGAYFDIGVKDNIFWQTLNGRPFYYSQYEMSYLGDHFSPILYLLVPLYAIFRNAVTLILCQSAALAAGSYFVHRIARAHLDRPESAGGLRPRAAGRAAWAFVVLYALNPAVLNVNMFDFHAISFMIPLALAAYDSYLRERWGALAVWLGLMATCKEESALTVAAFGFVMLLFPRSAAGRRAGAITIVVAAVYFLAVMQLFLPMFQGAGDPGWAYGARYGHLGASPGEVLRSVVLHPIDALVSSWKLYKLETLARLFLPLGLLPLLGWRALLVALPSLGYNYLSSRIHQFDIRYHYFSAAGPWLVIAAVLGFAAWLRFWSGFRLRQRPRKWIVLAPLILAFVATLRVNDRVNPIKSRYFLGDPYRAKLREIHEIIGPTASVSVTNRLGPNFSHRRDYFLALDFILNRHLNAALGLPDYRDTRFHVFDLTSLDLSQDREHRVAALLDDERYGVRYYRYPLLVFERGFPRRPYPELTALVAGYGSDGPDVWREFPAVFLGRSEAGRVEHDLGNEGHGASLRFTPGRRGVAYGPHVVMPPGAYAVDFHLRLAEGGGEVPSREVALISVASNLNRTVHAQRRLRVGDFRGRGQEQVFTLGLELERETEEMEFRTRALRHAPGFRLHRVVVRRPPSPPEQMQLADGDPSHREELP